MDLNVALQDFKKVEAEALVVGCHEDVRPLKGLAGELDWLLCGTLSRLLMTNKVRGSLGDVALVTPRGKIPVQKLFMVGLGPRKRMSAETVRAFARSVAATVRKAGIASAALEYVPADGTDDEGAHVRAFREGLEEGSAGGRLDIALLVRDAATYERISRLVRK